MLCEKCKVREANIKYTEIINGVKTEHNLCSHCAKEMDFGQYTALLDGEFPLGKLLSGLLGLEEDEEAVSYTHLDVYKRQWMERSIMRWKAPFSLQGLPSSGSGMS